MWSYFMNISNMLEKICNLLLLEKVIYTYQLNPTNNADEFNYVHTDLLSAGLSSSDWEMLTSPIIETSMPTCNFINFCLTYYGIYC